MDSPIQILIVGDHADLSQALAARIDLESDCRIVGATPPDQAMSVIAVFQPEVVVLDIWLGDDDGVELIEPMATQHGPGVVVLTSRADIASAITAFREGASAIVPKDAPIQYLLQAIRTVAAGDLWVLPSMSGPLHPEVLLAPGAQSTERWLAAFTDRERDVLALMVEGFSDAAIAERLHVSIRTVRTHVHSLEKKLDVRSRLAVVALAHEVGDRPE